MSNSNRVHIWLLLEMLDVGKGTLTYMYCGCGNRKHKPQEDRLKLNKRKDSSSGVGRCSDALEVGAET